MTYYTFSADPIYKCIRQVHAPLSFCSALAVFPGRDAVPGLELAVEVGEVLKAHLSGNVQDAVTALAQQLCRRCQPPPVQVGREAAAGHLPEPPHKMAGTAAAALRHLSDC